MHSDADFPLLRSATPTNPTPHPIVFCTTWGHSHTEPPERIIPNEICRISRLQFIDCLFA